MRVLHATVPSNRKALAALLKRLLALLRRLAGIETFCRSLVRRRHRAMALDVLPRFIGTVFLGLGVQPYRQKNAGAEFPGPRTRPQWRGLV
jgi:hypothetical protein